jgi:hypothetical protein
MKRETGTVPVVVPSRFITFLRAFAWGHLIALAGYGLTAVWYGVQYFRHRTSGARAPDETALTGMWPFWIGTAVSLTLTVWMLLAFARKQRVRAAEAARRLDP